MNTDLITAAQTTGATATDEPTTALPADEKNEDLTAEDLLEEVSIDGMCGVY
jgi:mycofactocin precursor